MVKTPAPSRPSRSRRCGRAEWSLDNAAEIASGVLRPAGGAGELARIIDAPAREVEASIARWNEQCAACSDDDFARPPGSVLPLRAQPPYVAQVWQLVSNTQGGPVHDAEQRVLDPFGRPLPGLYAAGELGSAFAECFIGGAIAGRNAARAQP